ncbi:MAG: hypothetical protein ACE5FN_01640 [Leptospirillia bacterium]
MKKLLTGLMMVAVLGLSLGVSDAQAADAKKKPKPPAKMLINGMSSGVMRVPEVAIWSCPGGQMGGCNLLGKLKHGTEVLRHEKQKVRGLKWWHITSGDMDGWLLDGFLQKPPE